MLVSPEAGTRAERRCTRVSTVTGFPGDVRIWTTMTGGSGQAEVRRSDDGVGSLNVTWFVYLTDARLRSACPDTGTLGQDQLLNFSGGHKGEGLAGQRQHGTVEQPGSPWW